jgi:hypothetical protein
VGVLVSTMLFGVDFCCVGHETTSVQFVPLCKQREMSCLGVIAEIVPLGGELVIVCGSPVMFGGE